MRGLIHFIIRFHVFLIFIFFETIALTLIFRFHHYQNVTFFNTTNAITGKFYTSVQQLNNFLLLKESNKSLAEENAKLRTLLTSFQYQQNQLPAYQESSCPEDTALIAQFLPAQIVNQTLYKPNNFITLNKGEKEGIKKNMGVIAQQGIVGIVVQTSENFSLVMSLLHLKTNISVRLKNAKIIGTLFWQGGNIERAQISGIPINSKFELGDTVVTSGYSSIFPKDIVVGIITGKQTARTENFLILEVLLSTRFNTLDHVYIVNHSLKNEEVKLEKSYEELSE